MPHYRLLVHMEQSGPVKAVSINLRNRDEAFLADLAVVPAYNRHRYGQNGRHKCKIAGTVSAPSVAATNRYFFMMVLLFQWTEINAGEAT